MRKYLGVDIESVGLKPYGGTIWSVASFNGKKVELIKDPYGVKQLPEKMQSEFADEDVGKVIHSSEFDVPYMAMNLKNFRLKGIWDTKLCEQVIVGCQVPKNSKDPKLAERYGCDLKNTLARYGLKSANKDIRKQFIGRAKGIAFTREEIEYMQEDVLPLLQLQKAQEYLLIRDGLLEVALLENACAEKIATMRTLGIGFDSKVWKKIAYDNQKEFDRRFAKLPNRVSNWNSPKQVKEYFKSVGILIDSYENIDEIYLETKNETLGDFITTRELYKAVTSYGNNFFTSGFVDPDNRIRTSVRQIINTGRMSFSDPNLQQLPGEGNADPLRKMILEAILKRSKVKPQHRIAFVPRKGYKFVIGDFSGQEIGIMAAASGESTWIDALLRGEDIHSLVASMLFDEWADGGTKKCTFPAKCECPNHTPFRSRSKVLNFMLAYGGGAGKFSTLTQTDLFNSKLIVKKYKRVVPSITSWLEKNGKEALDTGVSYSADPYLRRRVLRGEEAWQIVNQGKNNPVQSSGANMLKLAAISLPDEYPIVLFVHDEIVLEVKASMAVKAAKALKQVMEQSADYCTGIKGIIKVTPKIADNLMK